MIAEPLAVVARLAWTLDDLGIGYLVGGSLASSVYGIPRSTQDADLVADIAPGQVGALVNALADDFYADAEMIHKAIARRGSFNLIHLATMFKVDVFLPKGDAWSREEMPRARARSLIVSGEEVSLRFSSPEDTLLHKLVWYRLGNEVSDRQWLDVLGVLNIQGQSLDGEYLERWAEELSITDLLHRAQAAAGRARGGT